MLYGVRHVGRGLISMPWVDERELIWGSPDYRAVPLVKLVMLSCQFTGEGQKKVW